MREEYIVNTKIKTKKLCAKFLNIQQCIGKSSYKAKVKIQLASILLHNTSKVFQEGVFSSVMLALKMRQKGHSKIKATSTAS